jgi:hypothetical protein
MKGVYTASYQITGVTGAAKTLMYITATSSAVVELLSASVTQIGVTAEEQLDFRLAKISTLGTPTATTITPKGSETSTAGSTVKANVTASEPTYEQDGSSIDLSIDRQGSSSLSGYFYDPQPEDRPIIPPSGTVGLKLVSSPTNTYTLNVQIKFREIG